jgi:hypothetical protein
MQAKNEISEELRLLSAIVSGISRETPYEAPAGYFDGFSARVLSLIGSEERAGEPSFAIEGDKPLTFSVPEGYFDGFAENLLNRIKAGQGVGWTNSGTETRVKLGAMGELEELSPLLNSISREMPYETPKGYFASLSPILPILAEVRENPVYTVPEGYFEGLAREIIEKVQEKSIKQVDRPARVISLDRGVRQRSWWKYSAAAVVAGLIFTIGWLRLHTPTPTGAHGNHPSVDVATNLVKVSDQDLQNYLDDQNDQNPTLTEPMNSTAILDINDSDVKSLLGDVPDGDLKTYMEEHGGPNDIATN